MSIPSSRRPPDPVLFAPGPGGTWEVAPPPGGKPDPPANRTETSRAAAKSVRGNARSMRAQVLGWFISRGEHGGTNDECEQALRMRTQTVTARVNELHRLGLLRDSGRRRKTRTGRRAIVWTANTAKEGCAR